jgi:hypothetical protein
MKRILFGIAGIMMALALVVAAAPGTAGATELTIAETALLGDAVTVANGSTMTVTGTGLSGLIFQEGAGPEMALTNGYLNFSGQISGSLITSGTFNIGGTLSGHNVEFTATALSGFLSSIDSFAFEVLITPTWSGNISTYLQGAPYNFNATGTGGMTLELFQVSGSAYTLEQGSYANFAATTHAPSPVPLPPALLLFAPALFGLIGIRKRFGG